MKRIFNGSGGRKAALILSLCLIFALAAGATFAYLKASTTPVQNTFQVATPGTEIIEDLNGSQKKSIQIKNTGTATSYVRAKLVMNWVDDSGNVSATPVDITVDYNQTGWFLKDGIYYCKAPVAPEASSAELLKQPIEQTGAPEGCHLEVTVLAESIQAAPSEAVTSSWHVGVDGNGQLTSGS